jgi:hypothetical protein
LALDFKEEEASLHVQPELRIWMELEHLHLLVEVPELTNLCNDLSIKTA